MGWTVPISLFASITETRMVFSVMASRSCLALMRPSLSVGRYVTSNPWRSSRFIVSSGALERQVDALGRARGEDDLLLVAADQRRDLLARPVHGLFGLPAEGMAARGRIAEFGREIRHHRLQHPRIEGGGGVVVHVDGKLGGHVVPNVDWTGLL